MITLLESGILGSLCGIFLCYGPPFISWGIREFKRWRYVKTLTVTNVAQPYTYPWENKEWRDKYFVIPAVNAQIFKVKDLAHDTERDYFMHRKPDGFFEIIPILIQSDEGLSMCYNNQVK